MLDALEDVRRLAEAGDLGLSYDALTCILAQKLVTLSKLNMRGHRDSARQYVRRYQAGETLVALAVLRGEMTLEPFPDALERAAGDDLLWPVFARLRGLP